MKELIRKKWYCLEIINWWHLLPDCTLFLEKKGGDHAVMFGWLCFELTIWFRRNEELG